MEERKTQDRSSSKKPSQERNSLSYDPNAAYSTNVNVAGSSAGRHSQIHLTEFNERMSESKNLGQPALIRVESVQRSADPKVEYNMDMNSNPSNGKPRQVSDQFRGRLGRSQPPPFDIQHHQDQGNKSGSKNKSPEEGRPIRRLLNYHKQELGVKDEPQQEMEQMPSPDSKQRSITQFMRVRNQESQTCLSNQQPLKHSPYDEEKYEALLTFLDEYLENEESDPTEFQKIVREYIILSPKKSRPVKKDNEISERLIKDGTFLSAFVRYSGKDMRDQNVMMAELEPDVKTNRESFANYRHRVLRHLLYQKNAEAQQQKQQNSSKKSSKKKPKRSKRSAQIQRKSRRLRQKQLKKKSQGLGLVEVEVVNDNNEVISVRKSCRILKLQHDKMEHDLNASRQNIRQPKNSKRKQSKKKRSKRKTANTQQQLHNSSRKESKRRRTHSRSRKQDTDSSDSTYTDSESDSDSDEQRHLYSLTSSQKRHLQIEEEHYYTPSKEEVSVRSPKSPEDMKRSWSRQKVIESSAKNNSNSNGQVIQSIQNSQSLFQKSVEKHSSKIEAIISNRKSRQNNPPQKQTQIALIDSRSSQNKPISIHSSNPHSYQLQPQPPKKTLQSSNKGQSKQMRQAEATVPPTMPSSAQKAQLIQRFKKEDKSKYQVPEQIPCAVHQVINPDINNCGLFALVQLTKASRIDLEEQYALIQLRRPVLKEEYQKREECISWARKRVDRYFLAIIPITKPIQEVIDNQRQFIKRARRKSEDNFRISLGIMEQVPIRVLDGPANRQSLPDSKFSKTPLEFIALSRLPSRASRSKNKSRRSLNPYNL